MGSATSSLGGAASSATSDGAAYETQAPKIAAGLLAMGMGAVALL